MKIPGIMIAATASGSGKTAVTCALMEALVKKGIGVAACKCGPDYIDPMFHRNVLGIDSENLDLFFCEKEQLRSCFTRHASNADAAVIEGVMGYYDGMGLGTEEASSYDVARTLGVPVILVLPCRGMALSILAVLKGMLEFRNDSHISGIILNRISPSLYPKMKEMIVHGLREMGHDVKVLGYVPEHPAFQLESRHLGLILPEEIADLKKQIEEAAEILEKSVDLDAVLALMDSDVERKNSAESEVVPGNRDAKEPVTIAVARDAAFCFYYKENLEILKTLGCRLVWFSPLEDSKIPEEADRISGNLCQTAFCQCIHETGSERKAESGNAVYRRMRRVSVSSGTASGNGQKLLSDGRIARRKCRKERAADPFRVHECKSRSRRMLSAEGRVYPGT